MKKLAGYLIIFSIVLSFFIMGTDWFSAIAESEESHIQERAIRRALLTCYAVEGIYPPDIKYLENHYGVRVNYSRFAVHYEIFASNIMPEITLIEKGGDGI
ncbi:MAG: hypothetical protein ACOX4U_01935 [Anaerovoracaceae bacterium]|jgi:hypothetical protein